jgi:hypothetical protein
MNKLYTFLRKIHGKFFASTVDKFNKKGYENDQKHDRIFKG